LNRTEDVRAKCPYYCRYETRTIQCVSCVKRTRLLLSFRNTAEALRHKRKYCDTYDWGVCPYAKDRMGEG
jgi:hypothetical protein